MKIALALQLIKDLTAEELKSLDILLIVEGMSKDEVSNFLLEKNKKIFGGINNYIDDFLLKTKNMANPRDAKQLLEKMRNSHGVSEHNKKRVQTRLNTMLNTAPAAGGSRKKSRKQKRRATARK